MAEISEINAIYFSSVAGILGCMLFLFLRPRSGIDSKSVAFFDIIGLVFASLFCGIGAFLYSRNYFSKPDDYLMSIAIIPMISGFVLPSFLKGVAFILKTFQTNPLGVAKALRDLWGKK